MNGSKILRFSFFLFLRGLLRSTKARSYTIDREQKSSCERLVQRPTHTHTHIYTQASDYENSMPKGMAKLKVPGVP